MNKSRPKILYISLCLILILGLFSYNTNIEAKTAKIRFTDDSVSVRSGKTKVVKTKKSYKKLKFSASKKGIVSVKYKGRKITITGKKNGTVVLTVKGYNKKGKLVANGKINVKVTKVRTNTPEATNTPVPTIEPTASPEPTAEPTASPEPTATPTETPAATSTPVPTIEPTASPEPTATPTATPTETPAATSTTVPTTAPTSTPTPVATGTPVPSEPSEETKAYDAGDYSITNSHSGNATFYDRTSTGAANLDDYEEIYYTAAMNNEDYMNGLAGAYIEITDKDGDKLNVMITDRLPEGMKGDIDLSIKAFNTIEPEITGRMNITWKIIPLPTDDPVSFLWKPDSTQYWAEVQVRNGRYPIKSLEYYDANKETYVEMERKEYNYFAAPNGLGGSGPYKFRITDFYGHVLIQDNIAINIEEEPVPGTENFPY